MIEGLSAKVISQTDTLTEISLLAQGEPNSEPDSGQTLSMTLILVIGPPDPNALSYLVPRAIFARGHPVHVGALALDDDHTERLLEILEVMDPDDIAIFLCEDGQTISRASTCLGLLPSP
jgi:hypothetical protein